MSRKRPTADQMNELLSQPHFRRDSDTTQTEPSNTPVTATPMLVDVDKLVPYDRNPRRTPNVEYEQLKEWIRTEGFNQVQPITQRPDTDQPDVYMIAIGGNTRLAIMQELWRETEDERFRQVRCEFRPWQGETHALVAHIQDNDLRGDLSFIDRALAVNELRAMLEAEAGESLSQRVLRDRLAERGYKLSKTRIRWYDYTVNTLQPLIPTVLATGVGRPTIERIYELQRAFSRAWESVGLASEEADALFTQILERHDGDLLDLDLLRRDLEEELSISADCDFHTASIELGSALHGGPDTEAEKTPTSDAADDSVGSDVSRGSTTPTTDETAPKPPTDAGAASPTHTPSATTSSATAPAQPADSADAGNSEGPASQQPSAGTPDNSGSVGKPDSQSGVGVTRPPETPAGADPLPRDLKSLRSRTWTLASRIANGARLGDIVIPIKDGLGYLVGPVPIEAQKSWHPEIGRSAMCVWWHLATLAEQFTGHGHACAHMPDAWQERRIGDAMRQARDGGKMFSRWQWEQADRDLFTDVPPLEPTDMGPMLYQSWSDQRWQDWIHLVETYREIYRVTGDAPWEDT